MSTNEELVSLIRSGQNVSENMQQLYLQNKRFIRKIALRYRNRAEIEDLMQDGFLALYPAVDHYDPEKNVSFLTYAEYWIKEKMIRSNKPLPDDVRLVSLDTPIQGADECTLEDVIPDDSIPADGALNALEDEELKAVLWGMVDGLPDEQSNVIKDRYRDGKTLKESARQQDLSVNQVCDREKKALKALGSGENREKLMQYMTDDMIYNLALRGNGSQSFNRTWTSSTERVALLSLRDPEEIPPRVSS